MKNLIAKINLSIIFLALFFNVSFSQSQKKIILISKDRNSNIKKWLYTYDSTFTYKEAYLLSKDSLTYYLSKCSGIAIGGGNDIDPNLYGKKEKKAVCGDLDLKRDTLESTMVKYGIEKKI